MITLNLNVVQSLDSTVSKSSPYISVAIFVTASAGQYQYVRSSIMALLGCMMSQYTLSRLYVV